MSQVHERGSRVWLLHEALGDAARTRGWPVVGWLRLGATQVEVGGLRVQLVSGEPDPGLPVCDVRVLLIEEGEPFLDVLEHPHQVKFDHDDPRCAEDLIVHLFGREA